MREKLELLYDMVKNNQIKKEAFIQIILKEIEKNNKKTIPQKPLCYKEKPINKNLNFDDMKTLKKTK